MPLYGLFRNARQAAQDDAKVRGNAVVIPSGSEKGSFNVTAVTYNMGDITAFQKIVT